MAWAFCQRCNIQVQWTARRGRRLEYEKCERCEGPLVCGRRKLRPRRLDIAVAFQWDRKVITVRPGQPFCWSHQMEGS